MLIFSLKAAIITNAHNDVSVVHGKVRTAPGVVISVRKGEGAKEPPNDRDAIIELSVA